MRFYTVRFSSVFNGFGSVSVSIRFFAHPYAEVTKRSIQLSCNSPSQYFSALGQLHNPISGLFDYHKAAETGDIL